MATDFPCNVLLSHNAKDKAVACISSLSASNGERAGVRCRWLYMIDHLRKDGPRMCLDEWEMAQAEDDQDKEA
jgi:hypothetical protein